MSKPNYDYISKYYDSLVSKFGDSHKSCDYGSEERQKAKFLVLSQFISSKDSEILDVGCGTGEFYTLLQENVEIKLYQGIDLSKKMIDICRQKHPDVVFAQQNVLDVTRKFDFLIANGIFYLIQENSMEEMQKIIKHMFQLAKKGIAFNSLSSWATKQESGEFYANPFKVLEFCSTLTSKLVLRHDYLPHDFTIYMYK
jgi:ubiquinone/menaquinone biosynthesis C-methylase UbiE